MYIFLSTQYIDSLLSARSVAEFERDLGTINSKMFLKERERKEHNYLLIVKRNSPIFLCDISSLKLDLINQVGLNVCKLQIHCTRSTGNNWRGDRRSQGLCVHTNNCTTICHECIIPIQGHLLYRIILFVQQNRCELWISRCNHVCIIRLFKEKE